MAFLQGNSSMHLRYPQVFLSDSSYGLSLSYPFLPEPLALAMGFLTCSLTATPYIINDWSCNKKRRRYLSTPWPNALLFCTHDKCRSPWEFANSTFGKTNVSRLGLTCTCHKVVRPFDLSIYNMSPAYPKWHLHSGPESRNCSLLYGTLFMGTCIAKLCMIWFFLQVRPCQAFFTWAMVRVQVGCKISPY